MDYQHVVQQLRTAYNGSADNRNTSDLEQWKLTERQRVLDVFQAADVRQMLEIGAGTGKDGAFFHDHGFDVVCTDLSPEMVRHCQAKGLTAHVMDFLKLDFAPASFDAVYALNCLLHVPKHDLPAVLDRMRLMLKPGSLFYIGVYGGRDWEGIAPFDWHNPKRFFSYYTDEDLIAAVTPVFDVVAFEQITIDPSNEYHFQSLMLREPNMS
jgi:SAM-dependent methyltransferase